MKNEVLHIDNHCIVVNKHVGDIVQGDKTGDKPLLEDVRQYIKVEFNKPGNVFCGLVHRLDRPTSGALLFARTSKALTRLNEQFKAKTVKKIYWAVIEGKPEKESDRLEDVLLRNNKKNKSFVTRDKSNKEGKKAVLNYKLIGSSDRYSLLEIDLETGRHHQIRVQLSSRGMYIKGDLKYGAKRSNKDGGIHLHARKLSFSHPTTKEEVVVFAPPPNEVVWNIFDKEKRNEGNCN